MEEDKQGTAKASMESGLSFFSFDLVARKLLSEGVITQGEYERITLACQKRHKAEKTAVYRRN